MTATTILDLNRALAGRYAVERELGHGGMATVYLAADVRHHRKVAIKVLRADLAAVIGAERFVREIQTIATLQHPHILGLIDSGEVDGTAYYVMPFVEGESLRDRLAREKQLPVDEAVRIAGEVAGALDYAHRHGVIHRDIKPENILLHDGSALVADFGIALAVSSAGTRMTESGMSLGTPHYMSPEQAMGERQLGARSDVYALGCVLYEMLIGEPPFTGPTAQAIVARVVTDSPRAIGAQRKSVPPHVEAGVLRALEKLPADRFATAREFAEAISGRVPVPDIVTTAASVPQQSVVRLPRAIAIGAGVAMLVGAGAYAIGARAGRAARLSPEWTGELLPGPAIAGGARVSPDGQTVAFDAVIGGQLQVAVLKPGTRDWTVLTHDRTRGIATSIAWSRDGSRIYYSRFLEAPRGIWSISPLGGDERLVLEDAWNPEPLPDGSLLVARMNAQHRSQMFRFHPENGQLDTLEPLGGSAYSSYPVPFFRAFPDGKRVAYWGRDGQDTTAALRVFDLATGRSHVIDADPRETGMALLGWATAAISPDGNWAVVVRPADNLLQYVAVAVDGSRRERVLFHGTSSYSQVDVGPDGSLYVDETSRPLEIHRYEPGTGRLERTVLGTGVGAGNVLFLSDGRWLINAGSLGRSYVMVGSRGKEPTRFMQTNESAVAGALLGRDAVILRLTGADGKQVLATASIATGRIIKRFAVQDPPILLAGSVDGQTIFFVRGDDVWSLAVATGAMRRVTTGLAVATDPSGKYLVVERMDSAGVHLVRVPLDGSNEQEIRVRGDLRLAPWLGPNAVARDGRIAVLVSSPASYFNPVALVDPKSGKVELTESGFDYDMPNSAWTEDGALLSTAASLQSRIWRLKPAGPTKWWQ